MGPTLGSQSYFLLAYQTAKEVLADWTTYKNSIYQFNGGGLSGVSDFSSAPSNKGSFAPTPITPGQVRTEGTVRIAHDADRMGFWLQQILLDDSVTTVQVRSNTYELIAAAALTNDTALAGPAETGPPASAKKQPRYKLPTQSNAVKGLNCAKVEIEWTAAGSVPATGAKLEIKGFDQGLRPLTELISLERGTTPVTSAGVLAVGDEVTTTNRFAEITSITPSGFTTPGSVEVNIDASEYFKHTLSIGDTLLNGMSMEFVRGGRIPFLYQDVHIGEATYTAGAQNEISMSLRGSREYPERNAENGGADVSSLTGKTRPQGRSAPGFGTIFRLNDMAIRCGEASVRLNHSLGDDENPWAREVYFPPPLQTANREVGLSTRLSFPAQLTDGTELSALELYNYAWGVDVATEIDSAFMDFGAAHNSMLIELPTGRLSRFPVPTDVGQGQINNPVEVSGHKSGTTPDLRITVLNTENATQFVA